MRLHIHPPLPGKAAHLEMAPEYRKPDLCKPYPECANHAAVAALLTPVNEGNSPKELLEWTVLLIRRDTYDGAHSGQISFPGGKAEKTDVNFWGTACREIYEEVGIKTRNLEKIGALTDLYVPPSNFLVHPFAAVNHSVSAPRPDPTEVVEYKFVPLKFLNPADAVMLDFEYGKNDVRPAPAWEYEGFTIWGATGMMLAELYRLIDTKALGKE